MFELNTTTGDLDKLFEEKVAEMEARHNEEVNRLREKHLRRVAEMEKGDGRNGEIDPALQFHIVGHQRFMNEHEQVHLLSALNF